MPESSVCTDLAAFFLSADVPLASAPTYLAAPPVSAALPKPTPKHATTNVAGASAGGAATSMSGAGGGGSSKRKAPLPPVVIASDSDAPKPLSAHFRCHAACGLIVLFSFLIRYSVSAGSHSGRAQPPMYGDYEAQRHWMEVTTQLPLTEWYHNTTRNDLQYWGLDYPPLTAYVSWLCGKAAQWVGLSDLVALHTSRGYESVESQSFMRATVLIADFFVFVPALWVFTRVIAAERSPPPPPPPAPTLPPVPAAASGSTATADIKSDPAPTPKPLTLTLPAITATDPNLPVSTAGPGAVSPPLAPAPAPAPVVVTSAAALTLSTSTVHGSRHLMSLCILLVHPAFVLIDHGHFQYNCVSLGLAVWAIHYCTTHSTERLIAFSSGSGGVNGTGHSLVTATTPAPAAAPATAAPATPSPTTTPAPAAAAADPVGWHPNRMFIGSILFVCSFLFKQMNLYYAPAFFALLVGRAFTPTKPDRSVSLATVLGRILWLGLAVIGTAVVVVGPFVWYGGVSGIAQVIHRVFPFARGLFEDKVANFWCATHLLVKWNQRFAMQRLIQASLVLTLACIIPACVRLARRPTRLAFLYGLVISAFGFYLFSFQVHEKTILLPLLPLSLLVMRHTKFVCWAGLVANFSLYPLLLKDGQPIPYFVLQTVFYAVTISCAGPLARIEATRSTPAPASASQLSSVATASGGSDGAAAESDAVPEWPLPISVDTCIKISTVAMIAIHVIVPRLPPHPRYPDITNYVFALFSFAHFVVFLAIVYRWMFVVTSRPAPPAASTAIDQLSKPKSQ